MNKCGDCKYFVRDGRCEFLSSPEGKKERPFEHAPFWVWSDCYSDREQVFSHVETLCPTFSPKAPRQIEEPQSGDTAIAPSTTAA